MPRTLGVNDPDGEQIGSAESIPGLARLLEGAPPGRYHIDEISADPLPSGLASRGWGFAIMRGDGFAIFARDIWANLHESIANLSSASPDDGRGTWPTSGYSG